MNFRRGFLGEQSEQRGFPIGTSTKSFFLFFATGFRGGNVITQKSRERERERWFSIRAYRLRTRRSGRSRLGLYAYNFGRLTCIGVQRGVADVLLQ